MPKNQLKSSSLIQLLLTYSALLQHYGASLWLWFSKGHILILVISRLTTTSSLWCVQFQQICEPLKLAFNSMLLWGFIYIIWVLSEGVLCFFISWELQYRILASPKYKRSWRKLAEYVLPHLRISIRRLCHHRQRAQLRHLSCKLHI